MSPALQSYYHTFRRHPILNVAPKKFKICQSLGNQMHARTDLEKSSDSSVGKWPDYWLDHQEISF